jgi:hypothetical protein
VSTYVITDLPEAQQIWRRPVNERQMTILEHEADFAAAHRTGDGGRVAPPMAWVRAGDGMIRFNLALFHPAPRSKTGP